MMPRGAMDLPKGLRDEFADVLDFLINVLKLDVKNHVYQVRYRILKMFQHFQAEGYQSVADVEYDDYINYMQSLGNISKGTFKMHKGACMKVAEWAYHRGIGDPDVLYKLKMLRVPRSFRKPPPIAFTDEQIAKIFEQIDIRYPYEPLVIDKIQRGMNTSDAKVYRSLMNVQMRCLVWMLLETGARISELYPLSTDDVDPINETIVVVGKFTKPREIPYSERLKKEVRKWLAHREYLPVQGRYLWVSCYSKAGEQPSYGHYYRWINRMMGVRSADARNAKLDFICNWHKFRKTFATRCYEDGMDLGVVSRILGHEDIATTMIYLGIDRQRVINEAKLFEESRAQRYEAAASGALKAKTSR